MEATPENLQALAAYLTQTLSDKYEIRKPAEDYLMSVEATPNYATLLLQLTDSDQVEMHIRLAASINFKNFVKRNWRIVEDKPNKVRQFVSLTTVYHMVVPHCTFYREVVCSDKYVLLSYMCTQISENDRELIKKNIVGLMLRTPESLQRQLSDAITIIGTHCCC